MQKQAGFEDSDYENLDSIFNKKKTIRLADVQDRIEKVAFDVVRFVDADNLDKLWVVKDEGGHKVLVALYDEGDEVVKEASAKVWNAIPDKLGNVTVYYKSQPITKIAVSSFGIPKEDVNVVCRSLPNLLATDGSFLQSMLKTLDASDRDMLLSKHPELIG